MHTIYIVCHQTNLFSVNQKAVVGFQTEQHAVDYYNEKACLGAVYALPIEEYKNEPKLYVLMKKGIKAFDTFTTPQKLSTSPIAHDSRVYRQDLINVYL